MVLTVTPQIVATAAGVGGVLAGLAGKVLSEHAVLDVNNLTFSRGATLGGLAILVAGIAHMVFDSVAEKNSKEWLQKNWFIVSAAAMSTVALLANITLIQSAAILTPASLGAFVAYRVMTH